MIGPDSLLADRKWGSTMFGFRNRKKYNGTVDTKLNNEYGIKTQGNSNFPGALAYLELIDGPFNNGYTEDECALGIATLYLSGAIKRGLHDESGAIESRMHQVVPFGIKTKQIRQELWSQCNAILERARNEAGSGR